MRRHQDVSAYILAGGASSRMGRNKGLIKIAGEPMILRTALLVEPIVSSVTVIGPARPYRRLGLATIPDRIPGVSKLPAFQGPLAGILTALAASTTPWNLVLACDLPYLSPKWVGELLLRAKRAGAEAYLPRTPSGLEPLAAVYRRDAYEELVTAFAEGVRKVTDALARVHTETVALEELGGFADTELVLKNMNTPEDLAAAQAWWEAKAEKKKNSPKPSNRPRQRNQRARRPNK